MSHIPRWQRLPRSVAAVAIRPLAVSDVDMLVVCIGRVANVSVRARAYSRSLSLYAPRWA